MIKVQAVKRKDIKELFGEAGNRSKMVKKKFPFPLLLNGDPNQVCYNFYGNEYIADSVIDAYQAILDYYGLDFIKKNKLDWYGGCFEDRPSRGSTIKSVHAWGLAIDPLPQMGHFRSPDIIPYHIVKIFKDRGFLWGGDWLNPDGMHFTSVEE